MALNTQKGSSRSCEECYGRNKLFQLETCHQSKDRTKAKVPTRSYRSEDMLSIQSQRACYREPLTVAR